jgi:integration host factor subunit beta
MKTITKKDLVDRIAEHSGSKRVVVKKIVQLFLDEIVSELGQGNRLEFRDFGVFEARARAARVAQNPKTMEKVRVPRKRTVKFKVGRLMKERLSRDEQPTQAQPEASVTGSDSFTFPSSGQPT